MSEPGGERAGPAPAPAFRPQPSALESWYREFDICTSIDLSASGVEPFSVRELTSLGVLDEEALLSHRFTDSETAGRADLRRRIAERYDEGDPDLVSVTSGSNEALFLALQAVLEPGSTVLVPHPGYHVYETAVRAAGAVPAPYPMSAPDAAEQLVETVAGWEGRGLGAVVVNVPHNPTGLDADQATADALYEVTERQGAYLLHDAAFDDLRFGGGSRSFGPVSQRPRYLAVGTMSKSFGLPGLRIGWLIAREELLARTYGWKDATSLLNAHLSEVIASECLGHADRLLSHLTPPVLDNLATLRDWARECEHLVEWTDPDGGVCAFPRLRGLEDSTALCRALAAEHDVLLVPGAALGSGFEGHVRIGYGVRTTDLAAGLSRVRQLLEHDR